MQDDQHESYMRQEQQPQRDSKLDLRVHACLYFIRPTGHSLKPLDIETMKRLGSRVNLIPIVAKADTLTPTDLASFKAKVRSIPSILSFPCRTLRNSFWEYLDLYCRSVKLSLLKESESTLLPLKPTTRQLPNMLEFSPYALILSLFYTSALLRSP